MVISEEAGSLSQVLNLVAQRKGNILAINQTIPINGIHTLSLTLDIHNMEVSIEALLSELDALSVIDKLDLIAVE